MAFKLTYPSYRAQQLLFTFGIFRLILATTLVVFTLLPDASAGVLPASNSESLRYAALAYLVLAILGLLVTVNEQLSKTPVTILLTTDLLLLMLIMRYAGGVDTGVGNLMLISVGIGGLLLPLQQSLLVAAIATSTVVYTEMLPLKGTDNDLFHAALLGIGFFVETVLLQYVGHRVKTTEQLARAQADTILDLRHLNELIVQRMRTGIIVITNEGAVRLMNDAARNLLNIREHRPFWLTKPLFERLEQWRSNPQSAIANFQADADHPVVSINFAKLQDTDVSDLIVFLEDIGRMNQQAQQLKLASLGRLTASIAHEIRNPLGAISHAAQLLEEAPTLSSGDQRLLDIINNHSSRVNTIIETILELSRRRPSRLEIIQLSELFERCMSERELQTASGQEAINVNLTVDWPVEIDVNQIKQVLHNLIDNGLRYSEQKTGKRLLQVTSGTLADTEQMYLDIEDRGDGVPSDQVKNLFEPFYTTETAGTGLGLYIAKELCEANQMQLSYVDDRPGACFRLVFSHAITQSLAQPQDV
ncbi:sensor histidine kinase [Reinekea blandensis]|uniref:histidine kinase n=1 Tax=Reinekea blandensis MED297 TaxID=314283 RepID=A4BJK1_9GAMM|nr:ATP-binding protein [Reinekea blandensis]EAR07705.1 Signal transduction histidine kinase [Reinekea sp. MED297] [Reinekea blandensis MED297]